MALATAFSKRAAKKMVSVKGEGGLGFGALEGPGGYMILLFATIVLSKIEGH